MIKVKNWSKYQSYKDRKPPWIRFHRSIIDDYKFQIMSADARALLPMLWLLACEDEDPTSGFIRVSTTEIAFRLRQTEESICRVIKEIEVSGFIQCIESVTKPLRDSIQSVPPETETETETEYTPTQKKPNSKTPVRPDYISADLWEALLDNRKFKKLQNTKLALASFCNSLKPAIDKGFTAEQCIGKYVSSKWQTFDESWMKGNPGATSQNINCSECNYKAIGKCKKDNPNCTSFVRVINQ